MNSLDGLFVSPVISDARYYFRFYADGRVVGVGIGGDTVDQIHPLPWLVWGHENSGWGNYAIDRDGVLRFSLTSSRGVVDHVGWDAGGASVDGTPIVALRTASRINGEESEFCIGTAANERVVRDIRPIAQPSPTDAAPETIDDVLLELDALVGMSVVKDQVRQLASFVRVQRRRAESALPTQKLTLHLVFAGPPGTGKTTVARLIGRLYRALGILRIGHLVEVERSDLVGQYIGHTAVQTNGACDRALGGVLFIDEAYSLASRGETDFGREAIDTLILRMENDRHDLAIVFAGYPQEMRAFVETNPGLESRLSRTIVFEDYEPSELFEIFSRMATTQGYVLPEDTSAAVAETIDDAFARRSQRFGNGRFVRTLFEQSIQQQALRLDKLNDPTVIDLQTLHPIDIPQTTYPDADARIG